MVKKKKSGLHQRKFRGHWKGGWETIGGKKIYFRSSWEAKYAHYLESIKKKGEILKWEFEPDTFWFDKIKRGVTSYLPDFKVTLPDKTIEYHEVKGWMDAKSKTKIKRMRIYHPQVVLIVLQKKELEDLGLEL